MPENVAERIKTTAFAMLRNAGTNSPLLDDVSNVLRWIGDLTEEEATEVIDRLSAVAEIDGVHNRCGLLLYFSLFRENQLRDLRPFDSERFKERLHQELVNGEPKFRTSLMWHMAGGAEDKPYPYETIRPYLLAFASGPYCDGGFFNLRRICDVHVKNNPSSLCPIILKALEKMAEYIAADQHSRAWRADDLQELSDVLAENCSEQCVLEGVALILAYRAKIPQLAIDLVSTVRRYDSARARELMYALGEH